MLFPHNWLRHSGLIKGTTLSGSQDFRVFAVLTILCSDVANLELRLMYSARNAKSRSPLA